MLRISICIADVSETRRFFAYYASRSKGVNCAFEKELGKSMCFGTAKTESYFCFCHSLLMGMHRSHLNTLIFFLDLQMELCISSNHMKLLFDHVLLTKMTKSSQWCLENQQVNQQTASLRTHDLVQLIILPFRSWTLKVSQMPHRLHFLAENEEASHSNEYDCMC